MKNILTGLLVLFTGHILGQTVIFSDDFESYTSGSYLGPQSADWTTWSAADGTAEDAFVSNEESNGGVNSIKLESTNATGGPTDVWLPLPSVDPTKNYTIDLEIYIPSGQGGYFNIQQTTTPGDGWLVDMYFPVNGTSSFDQGGATIGTLPFSFDTWMTVTMDLNVGNGTIEVSLDGSSYGVAFASPNFGGINFYAFSGLNDGLGLYYIDDVVITEFEPPVVIPEPLLCESGMAGIYPCDKVDLMSFVPLSDIGTGISANDIWGWTDPLDNAEYVLLGLTNGVAFFNIEDPVNPEYLGHLPTHTTSTTWRDVKVYQNYAFIVSEAGGHGMQVFDLTRLRNVLNPPEIFTEDAHYGGFGNCHNIAINEATGLAYAVGTNTFSGGLHIIDITNPLAPSIAGSYAADGYTHDAQIVNYIGPDPDHQGIIVSINSNEDDVTIVDVTDPTDTQTISITGYTDSEYTHQGWLTPDHKYYLQGDELDEFYNPNINNTRTYIWDVQDLDNPVMIGIYEANNAAIDHNLYTRGNLVFQSNYTAGLRILDTQNISSAILDEVAFFDIFPSNDNTSFSGSWSNYPYFESGVVAVSGIGQGLFLVRPRLLNASIEDVISCNADDVIFDVVVEVGFDGPVNLSIEDLPPGSVASFSANDVDDGTTVQVTISNLVGNVGDFIITVLGDNGEFQFRDEVILTLEESFQYFADGDMDSYGDADNWTFACAQPPGFVLDFDDCDDTRNDVYPGAPGTGEGVDNNCDGEVTGDESAAGCPADVNNDGFVNILDLIAVSSDFGCNSGSCSGDANGDGFTNILDVIAVSSAFGTACP